MFLRLPPQGGTPRQVSEVVNRILEGGINSTGTLTVDHTSIPITVSDARVGEESVILFMPTNADGAKQMSHLYCSSVTNGQFIVTLATGHGSFVGTFRYVILG